MSEKAERPQFATWAPEPWKHVDIGPDNKYWRCIEDGTNQAIADEPTIVNLAKHRERLRDDAIQVASFERIVACVNACEGMQHPEKIKGLISAACDAIMAYGDPKGDIAGAIEGIENAIARIVGEEG